jgi:SAM-dependent methyltransferase
VDLERLRRPDRHPRSAAYDPAWVVSLDMGPHPLWLLEDLAQDLDLRPGMRVLDLGSGLGATSVFLVREFGVDVVAADLWVEPERVEAVFEQAGVGDRVEAVRAEAHALPFAPESFDAIVSIDAWEYFGTADSYLPYVLGFLRPGGQIGMATPALRREIRELGAIPGHIRALVGWEALAWHTAEWWRFGWEITELVDDVVARLQDGGWEDWLVWAEVGGSQPTVDMLRADGGALISFALVSARKRVGAKP